MVHLDNGSVQWLENDAILSQTGVTTATVDNYRYELRIRCVPQDLHDLYEREKATFIFYYDQVGIFGN